MLKKYQWVRQDNLKDCGVCSLLTIIKTYGGNVSKEYLRQLTKTNKDGTNAFNLLNAGRQLGFDTKALKGDVLQLDKRLLPCIAHVIIDNKYQHFVVIVAINKKKKIITISDPACGIKKYKIDEYNKISSNQYLIFIPTKHIPILKKNNNISKNILGLFIQNKTIIISIFIFSLIYTIINILTSFHFQFIIETVLNYSSKTNLYFIITIMIFLYLLKSFIDLVRNNLLNYINHTLDYKLLFDVYRHIISLPYLYYKSRTTGEVISRINDLSDIKQILGRVFMTIFVDLILIIIVFFTLYNINSTLTVIALVIVIMYLIVMKIFNRLFNNYISKNQELGANVNSYMFESINNIDTIKFLNLEENVLNNMDIKYNDYLNNSYKFERVYNLLNLIKDIINYLGISAIIFVGVLMVISEKMTFGELITYNSMIIYFLEPIKSIIGMEMALKKVKVSIERVNELYDIQKERNEVDNKYVGKGVKGNILVKDLNYSYNGRKNIFKEINFKIDSGNKVIIYGKSGSGKSTIGKLLMRLFEIERNKIFIDGKDVNDYNMLELRKEFCYVGQNENLFNDTIYNNIVFNRECDYEEFLEISKITSVDEIIKDNVMGYDMLLEENGFNISGGERQRIILARALLKNSSVYIFDESLSQVDIQKEREILNKVFEKLKGKTIIYISHRFDNSDLFNQKIDMEKLYDGC